MSRLANILGAAGATLLIVGTQAHQTGGHAGAEQPVKVEQKSFGIAGNKKALTRTVIVDMTDDMRFSPRDLRVKEGDTLRFVFRNKGRVMHEWVLGTAQELKDHAELMRKFPNMDHNEAHMAHVAPGETREMVWHFNRPGTFSFACLMPGHFEAGMVGTVIVEPAKPKGG